jgi:phosphatidylethanolamine-binding protein (PEBP) family uncharacterized protein
MTKEETQHAPTVSFVPTSGKQYTLVMCDPDVPSQFQPGRAHWIVTNLTQPEQISHQTILPYHGPNPPSGTHQYFFGLFEQVSNVTIKISKREHFNVTTFVQQNKLKEAAKVNMSVSAMIVSCLIYPIRII